MTETSFKICKIPTMFKTMICPKFREFYNSKKYSSECYKEINNCFLNNLIFGSRFKPKNLKQE